MRHTLRVLTIALLSAAPFAAAAFDNGQYKDVPDNIRAWFKSVRSPRGVPCCDVADGHRTDYQMRGDNHFWVPIDGEWRQVPTEAVVHNAGNPTGEGVVWYSGQFWALYFLQQVSKVDNLTTAYIVGAGLIIGTPTLIFFGWLSDHIGRKPVILGGMLIAAVTYYPLYLWLGSVTQPGNINMPVAIIIVAILVAYVGMVYGPIGAFLAEFFPSRIRYTSVSVPYHIGNGWGGGLVPFITTAAFQATGSLGYALIYPIAVPAICFLLSLFLMPETKQNKIWEAGPATA